MTDQTHDDRRIDDRLPVLWRGMLTDENDVRHRCEIRDVSHAGTLITCDHAFDVDTDLLLEIEGLGEFAGRVKWRGSRALGLILLAGDDLALKRFAEPAGRDLSTRPQSSPDLLAGS